MRVTFAFVCIFAAVSCLPPPPPPRIPQLNYRPSSNNIGNNGGVYSKLLKVNTQYQPSPKAKNKHKRPLNAKNRNQLQLRLAKAKNRYEQLLRAVKKNKRPSKAINKYQPPPITYQPPSSITKNYETPKTKSVPVVNSNQVPTPAAPNSWLNPGTPAAGPVGILTGPGNCQYCAKSPLEPRCGINNVTYGNDCYLLCQYGTEDCDGPCPCRYHPPPSVPVVNSKQAPPTAAPNSWLNQGMPAAGTLGIITGPANCQYCAKLPLEPRCGFNNVTYGNSCYMRCQFGAEDCDGPCPCRFRPQPKTYQPPRSNTNNYKTSRTKSVPVINRNQAPAASPVGAPLGPKNCQYCSKLPPEPRCGINNVTYVNDCFMDCDLVRQDCDGSCPCSYRHPPNSDCWCRWEDHEPVCAVGAGAQSKTLASRCEAMCERMQIAHDGPCMATG